MPGLPRVSANTRRVSGRMAAANACGSRGSTNVVVIPNRGMVRFNTLWLPP